MVYHERVYIFIQLMYNKNDHLAKQSIFVRCLMSSLASTTPFPLDPRRLLHMLYMFIATCHCPKGILGLGGGGGGEHLKQTERHHFHHPSDKRHNLKYISYACAGRILYFFGNE